MQSVKDDIALHRKLPGFRQLIKAHRFEITVLTVLPAKAERMVSVLTVSYTHLTLPTNREV